MNVKDLKIGDTVTIQNESAGTVVDTDFDNTKVSERGVLVSADWCGDGGHLDQWVDMRGRVFGYEDIEYLKEPTAYRKAKEKTK